MIRATLSCSDAMLPIGESAAGYVAVPWPWPLLVPFCAIVVWSSVD